MTLRLTIDRFEGEDKRIAVLITDDGDSLDVPRKLLPEGSKAGDVLILRLENDPEATARLARETREAEAELDRTDPGGDVSI